MNRRDNGEYIVSGVRHWFDRDGFFTGFSLKRNACENEKKPRPLDREQYEENKNRKPREPERELYPKIIDCCWEKDGAEVREARIGDTVKMVIKTQDIYEGVPIEIRAEEYDGKFRTTA